jgi:hypothetical protein
MQRVTIVNLAIAVSALAFQVFVLYPWHHELSGELNELKQQVTELVSNSKKG